MEENKILYLITAYQNSDEKVEHVLNLIKKLNDIGVDTCFVSHVPNGLDKIAQLSKILIYDDDNGLVKLSDAIENVGSYPEHNLSKFFIYKSLTLGESPFVIYTRFIEYHVKPALSLLKSGIMAAKNFGYDWIVYMEYDTVLPESKFDLKNYFRNLSIELIKNNKEGVFYTCEGEDDFRNGTVWPFMAFFNINLFLKDSDFMSQWQRSNKDFFRIFGNLSYEEILHRIADRKKTVEFRNAFRIKQDMNYNFNSLCELSIFGVGRHEGTRIWEINKIIEFELISVKRKDGLFNLNILRTTNNVESYGGLDDVVSIGIDAWLNGVKVFSVTDHEMFRSNNFVIWGLMEGVAPKTVNEKLRFLATINMKDSVFEYCDVTLNIYDIDEYYKYIKGMDSIN